MLIQHGHVAKKRAMNGCPMQSDAAARVLADIGDSLFSYAWPGNVRELQNLIKRIGRVG